MPKGNILQTHHLTVQFLAFLSCEESSNMLGTKGYVVVVVVVEESSNICSAHFYHHLRYVYTQQMNRIMFLFSYRKQG
jgi:hypothetical protein